MRLPRVLGLLIAIAATIPGARAAAQNMDTVQIRTVKITESVYMLVGAGGNIGVSVGEDAVFLIDDQYAPLTAKIKAAVAALSDQPIRFVLNTHWHGDHTGGNEAVGQAGALIVAHDNVRRRMSTEQFLEMFQQKVAPSPKGALPVVTFSDTLTLHINGDEVVAFHVEPAHTDGDAVVHFRKANVVHMGDTFFSTGYPFVDLSSGGSTEGILAAADRVLRFADASSKIIPGHGPLSDRAGLQRYRDVVATIQGRVKEQIAAGKTLEQVQAARPSAEFDAEWGKGFIRGDQFVEFIYRSLKPGARRAGGS